MLDLITKEWTDQKGRATPLVNLEDRHLLNIKGFLSRLVKDRENFISRRQLYWEGVACRYDAEYSGKDWYIPGSAFHDVENAGEDDFNRLKVSLMLVSKEIRRRDLR